MEIFTKYFAVFLLFGLLLKGGHPASCPKICPAGWKTFPLSGTDHCYLLPPKPVPVGDFWTYQAYCASQNPNSYIIDLNTMLEETGAGLQAVAYLMQYMETMGDIFVWIGMYYKDNKWNWLDGEGSGAGAIIPKPLGPAAKNGSCAYIDPKSTLAFWSYQDCSEKKGGTVCEMKPIIDCNATPPPPETTTPYAPINCDKQVWADFAESLLPGYMNLEELMYLSGQTKISCGAACIYFTGCISFDFDSTTGDCRLLQGSSQYTCNFKEDPPSQWQHYDLITSSVYNQAY